MNGRDKLHINLKMDKTKIFIIDIFIIFLINENDRLLNKNIIHKYSIKKNIYTFWEPKEKMPGYLQLCIKTWKKFFPGYNITILDYETTKNLLGETLFFNIICKKMAKSKQADAIRVALLKKYGGIWMDADSIILNSEFIKKFHNYELGMIGFKEYQFQFIGFIYGKENCSILNEWLEEIITRVKIYKNSLKYRNNSNYWKKIYEKADSFDYLGNGIIDPLLKNISNKKFFRLESNTINPLPERNYFKGSSLNDKEKYRLFYFQKGNPNIIFKYAKYLLLLHNSWTLEKYKNMSENEFLNQDILLSKLFQKILKE